jgi:hypothetical protein
MTTSSLKVDGVRATLVVMPELLLHRLHELPDGRRARLRLPVTRDRDALHELLTRLGLAVDDLHLRRALRWMPNRRVALVAGVWDGARETVVGFAATATGDDERHTVVAEPAAAPLLHEALEAHASAWSRRVA